MTKDHLEMFAKAKEIQEGWKPEVGDRCIEKPTHEELAIVEGIEPNDIHAQVVAYKVDKYNEIKPIRKRYLWYMPSTDQLAEMWQRKKIARFAPNFIGEMYTWISKRNNHDVFDYPLQVIALHFVMSDLFNLTWDSENKRWVNV